MQPMRQPWRCSRRPLKSLPRRSGIFSGRRSWKLKNIFPKVRRGRQRCRTSVTRSCRRISAGLARLVRANSLAAMENVALWHERDISHSSVERVIMPDSTILIDYMLAKVTDLIKHLVVYPANMKRNLDLTGGLVYSQRLLLALD